MKRPCPICSGTEATPLYRQSFQKGDIALMDGYDVVACHNCGLTYADNIPAQAEFDAYYAVLSKYEFEDKNGVISDDYMAYYVRLVDFVMPHIGHKEARILDVGCSTGGLLSVFKARGFTNLLGIDPSPACARTVTGLYGIPAQAHTLDSFRADAPFDVIVLSAVLEHLIDLGRAMQTLRALLSDDGILLIEVPDAERFAAHISAPFQQFSVEHINYFTRQSLQNLLACHGFEAVAMAQGQVRLNLVVEPDVVVVAQKTAIARQDLPTDALGRAAIADYVRQCRLIDGQVKAIIRQKLSGKDKIIVWGVGTHTQRLIGAGLDTARVAFFVDSNPRYTGKSLNGIAIKSPAEIRGHDFPILISTYAYQDEIARDIRAGLKLDNEIITVY